MKKFVYILTMLPILAKATTHYVKVSGGTGDGLTDATAWSYAYYNTQFINPHDTVLFKSGDTFYGALNVSTGNVGNTIVYRPYGTGANPKFSGLITLNNWVNMGGNIWMDSTNINGNPSLNVVMVDGNLTGMGRYPKIGYLTYNPNPYASNSNSITVAAPIGFDPTGSEAVIRKERQQTDRQFIDYYTSSDGTLGLSTYNYGGVYSNNTSYQPGYGGLGFFLQNAMRYVTQDKDWYYTNNKLYMYFADNNPSNHVIKVSNVQNLIAVNNFNYATFQNIDFEGANSTAFSTNGINNITFSNCNWTYCFNAFICNNGTNGLKIDNCTFNNLVNDVALVQQSVSNVTVDSCTISNIGLIQGMGGSGDAQQIGLWIQGDSTVIKNNSFINMGHHVIVFEGNHILIDHNFIDNYGLSKDDCGGIYAFQFPNVTTTLSTISNNIINHGIGVIAGGQVYAQYGQTDGIYLDDNTNHVNVINNTIHGAEQGGIFLISNFNDTITGNVIDSCVRQLYLYCSDSVMSNIYFHGNTLKSTATEHNIINENYVGERIGSYLNSDYNKLIGTSQYAQVDNSHIAGSVTEFKLGAWKSGYNQDIHSNSQPAIVIGTGNIRLAKKTTGLALTKSNQ